MKQTKVPNKPGRSVSSNKTNRLWILLALFFALLSVFMYISKNNTVAKTTMMAQPTVMAPNPNVPADWEILEVDDQTSGSHSTLSMYIPPVGAYCNGCKDGRKTFNGYLTSVSGGYDSAGSIAGWRLYIHQSPKDQTKLPKEFDEVTETKSIVIDNTLFVIGYMSYMQKYEHYFPTISTSIRQVIR